MGGGLGCSSDGNLNETKFNEPMPWIGLYVAAASLACAIAMAADAIQGFRKRRFWFPSRYFAINAASLTVIAVAIKLSVDLNTPMPRPQDQLAKLSSDVLICTVMGNSMPSFGPMEDKEILTNIIALGILVITAIVNICIQLATGVIFVFWREHAFVMLIMLVLILFLSFTVLTVPTTKRYLEYKYQKKHELAIKERSKEPDVSTIKKLRDDLVKYYMMAHTCCPQFVLGRSVTCTAAGAFCLLAALTLAEAMLRTYLTPWSFRFCSGVSDYKWSSTLILVTQTAAVGVGTVAPAIRWFFAINYRCPKVGRKSNRREIKVEKYWIQRLVEMKECPLNLPIRHRRCRKFAHDVKNLLLDFCIGVQKGIVLLSKLVRYISIFFVSRVLICCDCCHWVMRKLKPRNGFPNESGGSESQPNPKEDLSRYVLHLEDEDVLVELMMRKNCDATGHCLRGGKMHQPRHLTKLLENTTISAGFKGVREFDSGSSLVPSLDCEEPPNCWALPVVTLTSIAIALPNVESCSVKQLLHGVNEGLTYVRLIEDHLINGKDLINTRKAADITWLAVDLYHKWLDVDLHKLSIQAESAKGVLEGLSDVAKNRFLELKNVHLKQCLKDNPSKWPVKVLAANSMYRISQSILLNYKGRFNQMGEDESLFNELSVMISDILGACLTNLHHVISIKCTNSSIEEREDSVRDAVLLAGKTEQILKTLRQTELPCWGSDQIMCINEWRFFHKQKDPLSFVPSPSECNKASSTPTDVCITID